MLVKLVEKKLTRKVKVIETKIFVQYDGSSDFLKSHRFNAKRLGEALLELHELIVDANKVINGPEAAEINVFTQAGFHQGSFGIELVVQHMPEALEVLKALGLVAAPGVGSLLALLKRKGTGEIKEADIIVDDTTNTTKVSIDGEEVNTSVEAIELLNSRAVRRRANKIVAPLEITGVDSFNVVESFTEDASKIIEVEKAQQENFTVPPSKKSTQIDDLNTTATIEFLASNKVKGTAGWRMVHLGVEVPVKISDEAFMESITKENAPSLYGVKFKVKLNTKTNKTESGINTIYTVTRVIGPA